MATKYIVAPRHIGVKFILSPKLIVAPIYIGVKYIVAPKKHPAWRLKVHYFPEATAVHLDPEWWGAHLA